MSKGGQGGFETLKFSIFKIYYLTKNLQLPTERASFGEFKSLSHVDF